MARREVPEHAGGAQRCSPAGLCPYPTRMVGWGPAIRSRELNFGFLGKSRGWGGPPFVGGKVSPPRGTAPRAAPCFVVGQTAMGTRHLGCRGGFPCFYRAWLQGGPRESRNAGGGAVLKPKTASQGPWVCASGPVLLQLGGPRADGEGAAAPPPPLLCHGDVRGVYVVSLACSITQPCLNEGARPAARKNKALLALEVLGEHAELRNQAYTCPKN